MAALYPVPMVQAADSGHAIYAGPVFSSCCEKKWLFSLTATNTRLRYHTLLASHTTFESKLSLSYNYVFITPKQVTVGGSAIGIAIIFAHRAGGMMRISAVQCSPKLTLLLLPLVTLQQGF